jgi:type III pantothenate kinase
MLLAIDAGNTNVKIGIFDGSKVRASWAVYTRINQMADEYAVLLLNLLKQHGIETRDIDSAVISCVVPPLRRTFNQLFERYFNIKPLMVGPGIKTGIRIRMDNPRKSVRTGLQSHSAYHLYKKRYNCRHGYGDGFRYGLGGR